MTSRAVRLLCIRPAQSIIYRVSCSFSWFFLIKKTTQSTTYLFTDIIDISIAFSYLWNRAVCHLTVPQVANRERISNAVYGYREAMSVSRTRRTYVYRILEESPALAEMQVIQQTWKNRTSRAALGSRIWFDQYEWVPAWMHTFLFVNLPTTGCRLNPDENGLGVSKTVRCAVNLKPRGRYVRISPWSGTMWTSVKQTSRVEWIWLFASILACHKGRDSLHTGSALTIAENVHVNLIVSGWHGCFTNFRYAHNSVEMCRS